MEADVTITVHEEPPVEMKYVEAKLKPELVGNVTPGWEPKTLTPEPGCVFSHVTVAGMPEPTAVVEISKNGDHHVERAGIARVQVPIPPGYLLPEGKKTFTENGTDIDIRELESADINVPTRENDLRCLIEGTIVGEFVIPDGTTYIKIAKFRQCRQMTSCIIPDSVVTIEQEMFRECSGLVSVVLPKTLIRIPDQMFRECTALRSIKIPGTVISIGSYGFYNCRSLMLCDCTELSQTDGQVNTTLSTFGFTSMPLDGKILFKDEETANVYKVATQWSNYANRMTWVGADS